MGEPDGTDAGPVVDGRGVQMVLDLILRLAGGDLDARGTFSGVGDEVDGIVLGLNLLAEELQDRDRVIQDAESSLARYAARLERSEASYRVVAAHADGLVVVDGEGVIRFANKAADQLFGFPTLCRSWPSETLPLRPYETTEAVLDRPQQDRPTVEARPIRIPWEEGEALLVSVRDVTELRRTEAELQSARRMSLVARLAGGVAHDFNNLLMVILGNVEIAATLDDPAAIRRHLEAVTHAGRSAAELTARLLAIGRREGLESERADLGVTLGRMTGLFEQVVGHLAELEIQRSRDELCVELPAVQVEQIVLNLVTNARDAVRAGGHIRVTTSTVPRAAARPCPCTGFRHEGSLAMLVVEDDGAGIAPEHARQVFEPFFSTKGASLGTGLGLATVRGIVERSGGHVCMQPRPGGGTIARVLLPCVEPSSADAPPPEPATRSGLAGRLLLVVDDEEPVRRLLAGHLRALGCRILEASGGREALRLAGKVGEPIDLLLTDVVMPDMDGWELREALQGQQAGLPTLMMSAYGQEALARHAPGTLPSDLLAKPFRLADVEQRILALLERA
jgi:two-component system, cell cycle sensor histidine kinase and response regulator CckA